LSYSDKFGNEGITAAAIIKITVNIAELDIFLLSCRILGRNVEFKFLDYIISSLKENNIKNLKTYYFDNGKNNQVKEFLLKYGFNTTDNIEFKLNIG
jgi:predicted enzyme involved in methoxymalonyl-ACP biosynthesis